ncbi:ABC transporter permease [Paenibacillus assamensis]|uniref:ABC transporter permease n=1 Tax=Paenibacillus assamensis TaxID=311244 RepID=UPI000425AE3D|nr:ABC-2 family transporter protein [Paenibacillus assamensis]
MIHWSEVKRHLHILRLFVKYSLMSQMEYRFNFITGIVAEVAFLIAKLLYVLLVFKTNLHIDGLSPDVILMFLGVHFVFTGIYMGFFFQNFLLLGQTIRGGALDMMMTKPISLQFLVSLRHIDLGMAFPNVITGIVLITKGWNASSIMWTWETVVGFIVFLLVGVILTYCLMIIPSLLSFWLLDTSAAAEISYALWDANNMPASLYHRAIQHIGTFILPFFLITNYGPLFVLGKLSALQLIWALAAPVLFFFLIRTVWKYALRQYNSSSL